MRYKDWWYKLLSTIHTEGAAPYAWGESDCYTFPLVCAFAITESDASPVFKGTYTDKAGALEKFLSRGWKTVEEMFDSEFEATPASMAQRGDLALIVVNDELIGGVCSEDDVLVKLERGIVRFPRSKAVKAYKVGRA